MRRRGDAVRLFGRDPLPGRIAIKQPFFDKIVLLAIVLNTAALVWEWFDHAHAELIEEIHHALLAFFIVELAVKLARVGWSPKRFFSKGWNAFDFIVIAATLLPIVGSSITILRAARMARLVHGARHLSHLRLAHFLGKT